MNRAISKHGSIVAIKEKHRERKRQLEADENYRRGTMEPPVFPLAKIAPYKT